MIKMYLIRHSLTKGNTLGSYIGRGTDEPLCEEGIRLLEGRQYPTAEAIFVSPMIRCVQTSSILYPRQGVHIIDELAECDFGEFENKSYDELKEDENYLEWLDSRGMLPFPGGEGRNEFAMRCQRGFVRCVGYCLKNHITTAAVIAHGGTIMSILDKYAVPHKDFYHWQLKNAEGYEIGIDSENWTDIKKELQVIERFGKEIG